MSCRALLWQVERCFTAKGSGGGEGGAGAGGDGVNPTKRADEDARMLEQTLGTIMRAMGHGGATAHRNGSGASEQQHREVQRALQAFSSYHSASSSRYGYAVPYQGEI